MKLKHLMKFAAVLPVVLTTPSLILASCSNDSKPDLTKLYNSALNEFYDWCKVPHPTGDLSSGDPKGYYDLARPYLTQKAQKLGCSVTKDDYGNIWFDVPATKGYESCQKIILQGHMDMVVAGLTPEEAKTTPIVTEITKDADGREILHSKDYKTSLGADDGIAIASIFALLNDSSVKHGPIRVIFTVDEESGMGGAENLDKKAIDSKYIFSLDGEGSKEMENIVCNGTGGVFINLFNIELDSATPTLANKFTLKTSGFKGGHSSATTSYDKDLGPMVRGNADRLLLEVLHYLIKEKSKNIEIATANDKVSNLNSPTALPTECEVSFATDATQEEINNAIDLIKTQWKTNYKLETWEGESSVKCELDTTTSFTKVFSIEDSKFFIENLGNTIHNAPIDKSDFEGSTDEERASLHYHTILDNIGNLNFNSDSTENKISFTLGGMSSKIAKMNVIKGWNNQIWIDKFGSKCTIQSIGNVDVWDGDAYPKAIQYSLKCYDKISVKPSVMKPMLGFTGECSHFEKQKSVSELHQVQLGPRIDNTHSQQETLYLDTFKNFVNLLLTIVQDISLI